MYQPHNGDRFITRGLIVVGLLLWASGCGGGEEEGPELPTDFGSPSNGLFTYEEQEGGTMPGIWARATVQGQEVVSDEVEVVLRGDSAVVQQSLIAMDEGGARSGPVGELRFGGEVLVLDSLEDLAKEDPAEFGRRLERRFAYTKGAIEEIYGRGSEPLIVDEGRGRDLPQTVRQALEDPCPGHYPKLDGGVREIGSFGGWTAMLDWTGSVGQGAYAVDYTWASHLAPEGNYFSLQQGETVSVPPDPISASYSVNFTMIQTPNGGPVTVDYLNETTSVGFSVELGFLGLTISFGYDIVLHPAYGPVGVGIGYGAGWSFNIFGLMSVPISFNLSSADVVTIQDPGYLIYTGSNAPCSVDVAARQEGLVQQGLEANPLVQMANALRGQASSAPKSRKDALSNSGSATISPLFQALSEPTGHGPAKHVAAATNADLYADYLSRGDDCAQGCPDTSLSYINSRGHLLSKGAASDSEKLSLGYSMMNKVMESVPQMNMQWALQNPIQASIGLVEEGVIGGQHDGETVFVSDEVIRIPATVDEDVVFEISAQEIADLVGATPQEVEGAKVCLNFLMDTDDRDEACATLEGSILEATYTSRKNEPSTIMIRVDLSSAAGFSAEEVEDWIVKPAMRVFPVAASDEPAAIALTAPKSIVSGGPASLSAMVVDQYGVPFQGDGEVEFFDHKEEKIGAAPLKDGVAIFQFVPSPVAAKITLFEEAQLDAADGSTTYDGYWLRGEGISKHSKIRVNGKTVADYGNDEVPSGHLNWYIQSVGQVGFALIPNREQDRLKPGSHKVELIGPAGEKTETFRFEIE